LRRPVPLLKARLIAGLFVGLLSGTAQAGATPLSSADQACDQLAAKLQSIQAGDCKRLHLIVGDGASRDGRPLLYRDFPPSRRPHRPSRVLLIGGIHGDELSAVSIVFQWMRKLEQERLQPFYWRVIPSANPDGLFADPASRVNRGGVDLNRNFPSADWSRRALAYWKSKTNSDPRRYPGKAALSEPEARWLTEQIREFRPDAIVSVHAPYGVLDYDGPPDPPQRFGYLRLHPLGTYPGSMGNYAGIDLGLPVITLELPHAGAMPTPAQSQRIWSDMIGWLQQNLPIDEPPLYRQPDDGLWLNR
jgi:protein MpaA